MNYVNVTLLIILVVGSWMGYNYGQAYYENASIQEMMEATLLSVKRERLDDDGIKEQISQKVNKQFGLTVTPEEIQISHREGEGAYGGIRLVRVTFHYEKKIPIPVIGQDWTVEFDPSVEKNAALIN